LLHAHTNDLFVELSAIQIFVEFGWTTPVMEEVFAAPLTSYCRSCPRSNIQETN
jgi:hypothetical protein